MSVDVKQRKGSISGRKGAFQIFKHATPKAYLLVRAEFCRWKSVDTFRIIREYSIVMKMSIITHFFGLKSDPIRSAEMNHHFFFSKDHWQVLSAGAKVAANFLNKLRFVHLSCSYMWFFFFFLHVILTKCRS